MVKNIISNSKENSDNIVKRLNMVITLLIELVKGESSSREKIRLLSDAGFDYKEIASILNKDKGYIAVELNTLKTKDKKIKETLKG